MQFSALVILLAPALALAQDDDAVGDDADLPSIEDLQLDDPGPFAQGDREVSVSLGLLSGEDGTQYIAGGAFSYYVLPGLAPGVDVAVRWGDINTEVWTLVPVKWVLYRSYDFAPYLVVAGGRIFIANDAPDLWIAGAGPGFHLFSSRSVGLRAQLLFYRLFPEERCGDGCSGTQLSLGLGIML